MVVVQRRLAGRRDLEAALDNMPGLAEVRLDHHDRVRRTCRRELERAADLHLDGRHDDTTDTPQATTCVNITFRGRRPLGDGADEEPPSDEPTF